MTLLWQGSAAVEWWQQGLSRALLISDSPFRQLFGLRGDQSGRKNTNKLLYHGLGEDVWAGLWVWWYRCCGTEIRRVCTVRLVATSRTSQSCVGGEVLMRGCAEHGLLQVRPKCDILAAGSLWFILV